VVFVSILRHVLSYKSWMQAVIIYPISSYSAIIVLSFLICDNRIACVGVLHMRKIYDGLSQGTVTVFPVIHVFHTCPISNVPHSVLHPPVNKSCVLNLYGVAF
jgi:hypothetical protein